MGTWHLISSRCIVDVLPPRHARHKKETYEAQSREEVELVKEIEAKTGGEVVHLPDVSEAPLEERVQVLRSFIEVLPKMACANLLHGQSIAFQAPFTGTYYDREREVRFSS